MKNLLSLLLFTMLLAACSSGPQKYKDPVSVLFDSTKAPFYHGVASGDPTTDGFIIWTRVTPEVELDSVEVIWELSERSRFKDIVKSGTFITGPHRDYTVKVDVDGLDPDKQYIYRFRAFGRTSDPGFGKTIAERVVRTKFAIASCSNYEFGYFNTYRAIANSSYDAVLHLGDYIYEYGVGEYGRPEVTGRKHIPDKELITLQDYRQRYSQYRTDPDLQAAHARNCFITIWDDHEVSNNSYVSGAQNHQEDEGDYETRKMAARQAYYEWMPIRETDKHYRKFTFGKMTELFMLDERLEGRTQPLDTVDASAADEDHGILGKEQLDWLLNGLKNSEAQWKLIGNQVIFSYLDWGYKNFRRNTDSWDGYPEEQRKIAEFIQENEIENVIFVTGDTHRSWAFEATIDPFENYNPKNGEGAFAIEFGTPSINSGNADERERLDDVLFHQDRIVNSDLNPHLKYANLFDHGFLWLALDKKEAEARFYFMKTLDERTDKYKYTDRIDVKSGETKLRGQAITSPHRPRLKRMAP